MTGRLRLRTLGDAALDLLDDDDTVVDHQDMSKAIALVTYLASVPTRSASREHLVDLLWSDLDAEAAKHALRQHLWHLRRRFGDVLVADRKTHVRLGDGIDFDRDALLAAAERGQCDRVVELYRGDFFPGFAAPGSNELERWIDVERARLRTVFIRCAEQLVRQWLSTGRARDGQALARRVRDTEPLAQHGWRLLIEAHISGSDDLGARVEADAFERQLAEDDVEADPASRALISAVRRAGTSPSETKKGPFSELVGREAEFAWLVEAWTAANAGHPHGVHIVAPAGFGKSRLLQEFRARLASLRARVVVVRADAGSKAIPLALASDLVIAIGALPGAGGVTPEVAATLVGLAPALGATYPAAKPSRGSPDEPHVRRAAFRDLLAAVAEERPLAILIDDFHWSDRESADLLAGAFGAMGSQRLLIVVAQRPADAAPRVLPDARQFTLAPLSETAISSLIANIATLPSVRWSNTLAADVRRASGGSPLLVVESLQLSLQSDVLSITNGEWRCPDPRALAEILRSGGAVRQRLATLSDRDRTIVTLLSMARAPLPIMILRAAMRDAACDVNDRLDALERSGFVVRTGEGWQIGHDEYASAALAALPTNQAQGLHAALGHALLEHTAPNGRLRRLAPNQLRLGNSWDRLGVAFAAAVRESAGRSERLSLAAQAAEFLGDEATDGDAQRLVQLLPLDMRAGLVTPQRRLAALLSALAVPAIGLMLALAPAPRVKTVPDYIALVGVSDRAGGLIVQELPFTERGLRADSALVLHRSATNAIHLPSIYAVQAGPSPANGSAWLTVHAMTDSGITDIFLTNTADGSEERLTRAAADDTDPTWSPDGTLVLFASDRWSTLGRSSVAVLDTRTRQVRQLTSGDETDSGALWSQDGSRIAFGRRNSNGTRSLCTVTIDASTTTCHAVLPSNGGPIGWISDSLVMVANGEGDHLVLARVDVDNGTVTAFGNVPVSPTLSPDGRWMICDCRDGGRAGVSLRLTRTDDPSIQRRIEIQGADSGIQNLFWRAPASPRYIERVQLSQGIGDPVVGVPYSLTALAFDPGGAARSMPVRSFVVSDTTVATVSAEGVIVGRRPGRVRVRVSAGGWRTDSIALTVRANQRNTLVSEDWTRGIEPAWIGFGEPRPVVDTNASGARTFSTAGDGRFHSGAFTRAAYPAAVGLTVTTVISTPITLKQWQELHVALNWAIDTAGVRRWDSRAGYIWAAGRMSDHTMTCEFKYPAGPEGPRYGSDMLVQGNRTQAPRSLRSGRPTQLTMQLFPDGRCGVALDGVAIAVANGRPSRTAQAPAMARVLIMGNTFRTSQWVGPLELRQGVDTSIAWPLPETPVTTRLGSARDTSARKGGLAESRRSP